MPTAQIRGVHPNTVDGIAQMNLTRLTGWARAILGSTTGHDDTPEEISAWVTSSWWEHEDDLRQMAEESAQAGLDAQRREVMRATKGALKPPTEADLDVEAEVESLMGLGPWLAEKAVEGWKQDHPEAIAAAEDEEKPDPLTAWLPVAGVTAGTATAMLVALAATYIIRHAGGPTGAPLDAFKTWHTMGDSRVRPSHQHVNGETVQLDKDFSNGIDHPSDRSGPAEETHNCRCWLTYDVTYGGVGAAIGGDMGTPFEGVLTFTGPDSMTGDGRAIDAKALTWDETEAPWPFKFEHDGPTIGQIDEIWYDGDTLRGRGVFHDDSVDPDTQTLAARAMELLTVWGVSIELDSEAVEVRLKEEVWKQIEDEYKRLNVDGDPPIPDVPGVKDGRVTTDVMAFDDALRVVTSGRFRGAALVDTAAFNVAKVSISASLSIAAAGGESAFLNPKFGTNGDDDPRLVWQKPQRPEEAPGWGCPLTIMEDGVIYGHVALRTRCHGAFAACVLAPDSGGDFSYFLTGEAERGTATGPLILGTTHGVNSDGTLKGHDHLANTGTAVADLTVGSDAHGTWCAGRLRPGVTERQIADLRGSTLSGEWHAINGKLRLVGILAVNSPGYLIQRRQGIAASFTLGASCCEDDPMATKMADLERELINEWATKAELDMLRDWLASVS